MLKAQDRVAALSLRSIVRGGQCNVTEAQRSQWSDWCQVLKAPGFWTLLGSLLYHGVTLHHSIHGRADEGQVEQGAQHWNPPDEAHHHREEAPEEEDKSIHLQENPQDGPPDEHNEHPSQEKTGRFQLMSLEEEAEGPLQANHKGQAHHKQDVSNGQERFVEEQDHPKEEEKHAKPSQPHPDLLRVRERNHLGVY